MPSRYWLLRLCRLRLTGRCSVSAFHDDRSLGVRAARGAARGSFTGGVAGVYLCACARGIVGALTAGMKNIKKWLALKTETLRSLDNHLPYYLVGR